MRNRTLLAGLIISLIVLFGITIGAALMPYSATSMDFVNVLQPPSLAHPFGTNSFGRDVLTRVLVGARISLMISFSGVALASVFGTAAGMVAAWTAGIAETALMGVVDLLFAFPSFVLALFLMVILGYGLQDVVIAIALVYFPIFARLARNLTAVLKNEPYVQAARLAGEPPSTILVREILPNILSALMVQATIAVAFGGGDRGRIELPRPWRAATNSHAWCHHGGRTGIFRQRALGADPHRPRCLRRLARPQSAG